MAFYDLPKEERRQLADTISAQIRNDLAKGKMTDILKYFADEDTYIRKTAYLAIGRLYKGETNLRPVILRLLERLVIHTDEKVRQTAINAAGEIGIIDFTPIEQLMDKGLFDTHHSVRNAVIGSIKKMGEKNPTAVLSFARKYLHHTDKEIRREICHGIELRGRTHHRIYYHCCGNSNMIRPDAYVAP